MIGPASGGEPAQIFIKFLFLSFPPRLEPLWRSGPYSALSKSWRVTPEVWRAAFYAIADLFTQSPTCLWQALRWKVEGPKQGTSTMDIVVLGIGILFFGLFFVYVKACDRI
ncbi:hypothetical protein [Mesorhizobium sangaii]|uniref:Uncharacterized protein n=1 Tax=Mesorhizobium sangaii TaxID=505389 RepID=A0A841PDJ7_9HYPH|nr:hypothetical protein [Mesorhizobium sangaii]MBB6413216.1 hypothetical protein [Mesorhizobium sangaii]